MKHSFLDLSGPLVQRQAVAELEKCSVLTERFGLALTHEQAVQLVETRREALLATGRLEFGGGTLQALIYAFCNSPYLWQENFTDTIQRLTELFYEFKNETLDQMTDDELIARMHAAFNGPCGGSLELLESHLFRMARILRGWEDDEEKEEPNDDKEYKD